MARLLGAKHRMCRRVGERLCTSDKCPAIRRQTPPGVHGPKGHPRLTEYGTQLKEKQKAKYLYGVMERQFRRYYEKSLSQTGNTAENFLLHLERRLDNVVYRLGFTKTRAAARQLVSHGWVTVNGKSVNIPSYSVRVGDVVSLKAGSKNTPIGEGITKHTPANIPSWLAVDTANLTGKVASQPTREDFPQNLNMTLVVEFYSR